MTSEEPLADALRRQWLGSPDVARLGEIARPALERLRAGMPLEPLRTWIGALHPMVVITPRLGAAVFAHSEDPEARRLVAGNLLEELAGEDHVALYERSLAALGVPLDAIRHPQECPGERELHAEMRDALEGTPLDAAVALNYGVEQGFSTYCRAVVAGLEQLPREAVNDRDAALRYWRVHATADVDHVATNRALVAVLARTASAEARQAARTRLERIARAKLRAIGTRMLLAGVLDRFDAPPPLAEPTRSAPGAAGLG